jgi:hypothetical protein
MCILKEVKVFTVHVYVYVVTVLPDRIFFPFPFPAESHCVSSSQQMPAKIKKSTHALQKFNNNY